MTPAGQVPDALAELGFALIESEGQEAPAQLRDSVMSAALVARPPGRHVASAVSIRPEEAYRRTRDSLDKLLASLDEKSWHRPTLRNLDVQGLVGHLIGVERDFVYAIVSSETDRGRHDHVTSTEPFAGAQAGRPPNRTLRDWRLACGATLAQLHGASSTPGWSKRIVDLHGLRMPLGSLLVVRAFEMWIHEEDIRRANGLPLSSPDAGSLQLMAQLAVDMLPSAVASLSAKPKVNTVRIVLTGPGGGTWQIPLDRADTPGYDDAVSGRAADVRIISDATSFCRLAANRISPEELDAQISGDQRLAAEILRGTAKLALD